MAGFIRRFTSFPTLEEITAIEGVVIVDSIPPGVFVGRTTGKVCLVGEFTKGPFNTPTDVNATSLVNTFGEMSLSLRNPLSPTTNPFSNGAAFPWLKQKKFRQLAVVRADLSLAEGVKIRLTGTPSPLTQDVVIPAGTRVRVAAAPTQEFALAQDVIFASGTDLTVVAFTAFDSTNLARKYTTRTVSAIPVYSVQGVSEGAVGDVDQVDSTDLFRAGIGAGTSLPSLVVTVDTGALDGAGANAAALTVLNSAAIDTRYGNAINATLPGVEETNNIWVVASARQSDTIRTALLANAAAASAVGTGRRALTRPPIGTNLTTARGSVAPGVGANRGDRNFFCYPHYEQNIPELATLDPSASISGPNILIGADSAMAMLLSNLAPELNPGQSTNEFISGGYLSFIRKLEDGLTTSGQPTKFTMDDYILMKDAGITALRRDAQISEWVFQSGVTSVDPDLFPSLAPIKRRNMADYIQDSLAALSLTAVKKPNTDERYNAVVGDHTDFLEQLLSTADPSRQRIAAYSIDSRSGNTPQLQGAGVRIIITKVQTLDSMDSIVLQTEIGESVQVTVLDQQQ